MTKFAITDRFVEDQAQRRNNDDLLKSLNQIGQFLSWGNGAPTFTPVGRAIYIRLDGGAGSTLYVWEGAAWAAK